MLTVLFSSRNGASVLPRFLDSLANATPPEGGWKLIAVDNASTDASRSIMQSYQDRLPMTVLDEPEPGKNRAMNRALERAEGDIYVFCDDDVVVVPDWLIRWREAADAQPDFDLFAGKSEPLWPRRPESWVINEIDMGVVFAAHGRIPEGPCEPAAIFGNNMAIRASAFADGLRFNPDIGPSAATIYPMGSETEMLLRLVAKGHRSWFVEGARVAHIIRDHQMARPEILLRAYRHGRGRAHIKMEHHYGPARLHRKNRLRNALYPLLMPFMTHAEAWARQWEWAVDQGYEDGYLEVGGCSSRWRRGSRGPRIASRFARTATDCVGSARRSAIASSRLVKSVTIVSGWISARREKATAART